ncbi:uncharacterized protein LOC111386323, partial [Olea europaea var. sylvestris]|uniref:uncharacterized protein LOC111386323 n=1 Tax=Olea europaea var. sylvestris TaxID=158386 RepID=UPI000C1D1B8D
MIYTDHESSKHLKGQGKLTKRHARWIEFIKIFPYVIRYKQGKENVIVGALSNRNHVIIKGTMDKCLGVMVFISRRQVVCSLMFNEKLLLREAHNGGLMGHFEMKIGVDRGCSKCITYKMAKSK